MESKEHGTTAASVKRAVSEKANTAASAAEDVAEDLTARVSETVDRAKESLTDVYEKGSDVATRAYSRAMEYGKENPRGAMLVALGAGIGLGLLFSPGRGGRRTYGGIFPIVALAAANALLDVFDDRRPARS